MYKKLRDSIAVDRGAGGQSLIELALVVSVLMFMLIGIVEYGFLLNQYLNLLDATRETARYGAGKDPFQRNADGSIKMAGAEPLLEEGWFEQLAVYMGDFLKPIKLDIGRDDIVISFFSVDSDGG